MTLNVQGSPRAVHSRQRRITLDSKSRVIGHGNECYGTADEGDRVLDDDPIVQVVLNECCGKFGRFLVLGVVRRLEQASREAGNLISTDVTTRRILEFASPKERSKDRG